MKEPAGDESAFDPHLTDPARLKSEVFKDLTGLAAEVVYKGWKIKRNATSFISEFNVFDPSGVEIHKFFETPEEAKRYIDTKAK